MGVDSKHGAAPSLPTAASRTIATASSSRSAGVPVAIPRGRKRKLQNPRDEEEGEDQNQDFDNEQLLVSSKKQKAQKDAEEEKRLRRFRPKPPTNFAAVYERATTQRFYVLSRTLCGTPSCPEMFLEVTGSTGNVYNVCIARQPTCDCPHACAGNQCKHTIFVLKKVLRAKDQYVYQLALLSSELREIFARAPNPAAEDRDGCEDKTDKNRKAAEGDCPICFEEMESGPGKEALVWCKAACGQNIHKQCFDMWATTKRQSGTGKVTCPYCRSDWEVVDGDAVDVANIKRGMPTKEGYVNVADQLGISKQRDYSSYSTFWSRHPYRSGRRDRDEGWGY